LYSDIISKNKIVGDAAENILQSQNGSPRGLDVDVHGYILKFNVFGFSILCLALPSDRSSAGNTRQFNFDDIYQLDGRRGAKKHQLLYVHCI